MPLRVIISAFGPPQEVLTIEEHPHREIVASEIRVAMQLTPIHPSDINLIEGSYGIKPIPPFTPGNEGFGIITEIGSDVVTLRVGDCVRPLGLGTWQQEIVAPESSFLKLPHLELSPEFISQIWVNPATAWRMLHDFVDLTPGNWIIQNAATSAVGISIIQIARAKGWKTLSFVRRFEEIQRLEALGADLVWLIDDSIQERLKAWSKEHTPRLALNAVGGESATLLAKSLGDNGTLVTYGAMSKQPLSVPNGLLIFKNIQLKGFWVTRWQKLASERDLTHMLESLAQLHREGKLQLPVEKIYPAAEILNAIKHSHQTPRTGKILIRWN